MEPLLKNFAISRWSSRMIYDLRCAWNIFTKFACMGQNKHIILSERWNVLEFFFGNMHVHRSFPSIVSWGWLLRSFWHFKTGFSKAWLSLLVMTSDGCWSNFVSRSHLDKLASELWLEAPDEPWTKPLVSLLPLRVPCGSSFIKSHSRCNCLVDGSIAALICRGTSSDVTGAPWLLPEPFTSTSASPFKLRVPSYFLSVVTFFTEGFNHADLQELI